MRKLSSLLCLTFLCLKGFGQDYYNDAQVWGTLQLEKHFGKKFSISLAEKVRIGQDVSDLGRAGTYLNLKYKFHKNISAMVGYAYIQKRKDQPYYDTRHKYYAALNFEAKVRRWKFEYRNMFQCYYKNPGESKIGYLPYYYDRNKVTVQYEATKRISFYVAEEVYFRLNDPVWSGLSKSRSYAGTIIKTFRHQQVELYFMYLAELWDSDWFKQKNRFPNDPYYRYYVYGVKYSIDF